MPYFALTYDVVDGFTDKRTPYRPQHLQLAREAAARGELLMAGALRDPNGALLVFRAADQTTVPEPTPTWSPASSHAGRCARGPW
jgi:uncharacterized protein YciI